MKESPKLEKDEPYLACSKHLSRSCTLVGYDKSCNANCLLCVECIDDPDYLTHKREGINHKTINLYNIQQSFQTLATKNAKEINKCRKTIDDYFDKVEGYIKKKLAESKAKLYQLNDLIMLTEITQDKEKLSVLENLFLKNFKDLKCSDVSLIAKELIGFKTGPTSVGYSQLNNYISQRNPQIQLHIQEYTKFPKYGKIVLDEAKVDVDYPLFHREKPPPPPPPPKKKPVPSPPKQPPPKIYVKPFSLIDCKDFRGLGLKKVEFGDSKIISKEDSTFLMNYLAKFNPKSVDLLYRATQNEFSVSKFHQFCDGSTHTIVLVKTEFNKIIGGYTPLPWKSTTGTMHSDNSRESFLFSISNKQRMDLVDVKSAIFNYSQYGPCFGAGSDLAIFPQADTQKNSYSDFPYSYNNSYNLQNNQQTTAFFTGQTKGKNFLIKEWQVWRLKLI